uniref:restriction endonuclease n=1 Tax=Methylibium sp. TaxID=2067992 RepID=UPI00286BF9C8
MNTVSHPPSPSPKEKGDSLEDAVRAIEDSILRSAPGFAHGTFRIEQKRIVQSAGVRHEVDLFVTASLATGYEATFIFECKNWQAKVGKNEIIVFSEKVATVGAQRGFFVARAFTRDARAQAAKDS